jgi:outer membrane protein assembly factor BamE (lipoprotein component of BamABCDE complex)
MRHHRPLLATLCGLLVLAGCAQQAADNFHAIRPGMTKAEVEDLLGRPSSIWTDDEGLERWHWGDSLSSLATSGVFREADTARVWVVWFDAEGLVRSSREPDWVRER